MPNVKPLVSNITTSNIKYVSSSKSGQVLAPGQADEALHVGGISYETPSSYHLVPSIPNGPVITKEADAVLKPHRTILDIPTLESGQVASSPISLPTPQSGQIKRGLSRISRRLYSRCILGLKLPGRYYFGTWTSSPQSPPIEKSWPALRKWLKRKRPGASWCYCITNEGYGVIHMILRLGNGEKRLDVNEVRAHWIGLHNANQIRFEHVPEPMKNNLASYLADQRSKRRLGGEMAWQDNIIRWRWSNGWLPKGFTKAFGRLWWSLQDISHGQREKVIADWLNACHLNCDKVLTPPTIGLDNELIYLEPPKINPVNASAVKYDIELKERLRSFRVFPITENEILSVPNKIKCRYCPNHFPFSVCWEVGCD
jgi:hypothetical protein